MVDSIELAGANRHHGNYILERGVWRATCRACGWQASDPDRRQAVTLFRGHIHDARILDGREQLHDG